MWDCNDWCRGAYFCMGPEVQGVLVEEEGWKGLRFRSCLKGFWGQVGTFQCRLHNPTITCLHVPYPSITVQEPVQFESPALKLPVLFCPHPPFPSVEDNTVNITAVFRVSFGLVGISASLFKGDALTNFLSWFINTSCPRILF